ncbi:MAG: NUDIX hydrolase [Rhodocyclaceae bacterium]
MKVRVWKPNVTVAALIERDGRFLLVEEHTSDGLRLNQPAGHLDEGESLLEAVSREAAEETAHGFAPRFLVGVYQWRRPERDLTYVRFAFGGDLLGHDPAQPLDEGIVRTLWLTPSELAASRSRHRSPLVAQCVADYLAGRRFPLDLIHHYS